MQPVKEELETMETLGVISRVSKPTAYRCDSSALRLELLDRIHTGHQGMCKCHEQAKHSLWWPGLSQQLVKS